MGFPQRPDEDSCAIGKSLVDARDLEAEVLYSGPSFLSWLCVSPDTRHSLSVWTNREDYFV